MFAILVGMLLVSVPVFAAETVDNVTYTLSETRFGVYSGTPVELPATKPYDRVKVMMLDSFTNFVPVCIAEEVEL